jgi:putative hydrolase of the HAD superfamily
MPSFEKMIPLISNYKLAVFSEDTSDLTMPKLRRFGLDKRFDLIITSDKIGQMKPSKEYYDEIFERFNVSPNECIVIGDNYENDLKIAKDMGATTIFFGGEDKRADFSIKGYDELPNILNKI